jgi:hypothetical protein
VSAADLRMLIEHASSWAEKIFARKGQILPMWHAVKASGEHVVMPAPPGDKDTSVALVRAFFELNDVVRCLFINEAWTAFGGEDLTEWVEQHGGSIHDYPDRVEVVAFMGEDDTEGMMTAHRRIIRGQGKATLGPLEFMDWSRGHSEGRLVGLLPRRAARMH